MKALLMNASAGSGKTYQLAYNYVRDIIAQPTIYRNILAVTFTNKATEEMKSRILKEIHRLASDFKSPYRKDLCNELKMTPEEIRRRAIEARTYILHDYSRFTVLTIDTFFQRVLRAFLKELDLDLNYNIELDTSTLLDKGTNSLIERITTDKALLKWMTNFVEERIEAGKSWDIRQGISELGNEIFKEKNRDAIEAIQSREALGELLNRLKRRCEPFQAKLKEMAQEIAAICDQHDLTASDFYQGNKGFYGWITSLLRDDQIKAYGAYVKQVCQQEDLWKKKSPVVAQLRTTLQPRLQALCDFYDKGISLVNTYTLASETYRSFALLGDLYQKVKDLCTEQQLMLLSETKYHISKFITEQDAPFIYEKVGTRFERFMIDEFQDTSVQEWENFLPLLKNALAQQEKQSVLLVGDIKQSIYRWRGGDWKILHSEAKEALGVENTYVKVLESNYRSLPVVVNFNNQIIKKIVELDNNALNSQLAAACSNKEISAAEAVALQDTLHNAYATAHQEPRRKNSQEGYVSVTLYEEEPPIVERICSLIDLGYRPSDMMILAHTGKEATKIATALLDFKSRNEEPRYRFDVMTQEALVIGTASISRFVAALFGLAIHSEEAINRAIYNQYLGYDFGQPLSESEREFLQSISVLSPEEAFEQIVIHYELYNRPKETAYLQALHEQILAFSSNRIADIALFLNWWNEQGSTRSLSVEESQTTIAISTIHKAKGLEKKVIIIPYCNWSLLPKSSGSTSTLVWSELTEEEASQPICLPIHYKKLMSTSYFASEYYREMVYAHVDSINLLYVALTRAAESLHIFVPAPSKSERKQKKEEGFSSNVGALLRKALGDDNSLTAYTFGTLAGPAPHDEREAEDAEEQRRGVEPSIERQHIIQEHYPTSPTTLQLSLPSERYFEQGGERDLSPRNFGILMHKAFEEAHDRAAIERVVEQMVLDGVVSAADKEDLQEMVNEALSNPDVGSWFDGSWDEVRCEEEIICPADLGIRRPDRVMIRGKQAVVVDYKFGELDVKSYRAQIKRYCQLLGEMGYTDLSGYLWYVKLGKIEKVI